MMNGFEVEYADALSGIESAGMIRAGKRVTVRATGDVWSDEDVDGSIANRSTASFFWLNGAAAYFLRPSGQVGPMPANGFFWQK